MKDNSLFRRLTSGVGVTSCLIFTIWTSNACLALGQTWTGPSFREFSGVNNAGTSEPLYSNALSWTRMGISWSALEPTKGSWNLSSLTSLGQEVQTLQAENVRPLPILCYGNNWAADLSSRNWSYAIYNWTIAPGANGTMVEKEYNTSTGALLKTTTYEVGSSTLPDFTYFPPANSSDWTAYVQQVVNYLHASPYNVQYFQIWNEAQEYSSFYVGSMSDYFNKIHLPAAQIIHAAGGKVVYGGWPDCASIAELISLLDNNNAWSSIDVIDTHYFSALDAQTLRSAADSRGWTDLAIWQTECGFTTDFTYIPDNYSRRLYWSLQNNWFQDAYKQLYFADWAPNASNAFGYDCCLNSGSSPSGHGECLRNLANLLGGSTAYPVAGATVLSAYSGVSTSPSFPFDVGAASCSESFAVGNTIIAAVNLGTTDYNNTSTVSFTFPVTTSSIYKAQRVDLIGTTVDLTSTLINNGATTTLPNVNVKDPVGSSARTWNDVSSGRRTFYVVITLSQPFEGENLSVVAQTSGITNTVSSDPNFSNGAGVYFNATASGQYVTYDVPSVSAGTYDVRVGVKSWNNKGIWQLNVSRTDGTGGSANVGSPVDEYNANTVYGEVDLGNWSPGTTSDKAFKFTVTGKNSASSGYGVDFDYIKLIAIDETENLAVAAQTSGITESVVSDPNFSNGAGTFFYATAAGQYVTYDVPGVNEGTYDVRVGVKRWNNKGIWQLAISRIDQQSSAVNLGVPLDEYNANSVYGEVDLGLWSPGSTSDKAFKFTVIGKNAASSGYAADFDYIKLIPQ